MKQKQYQQIGSQFLASRKNAILADEMGLGKTNQAVCAMDLLSMQQKVNHVLIACPAIVRPQWESQLKQWLLFHNPHPIQVVDKSDTKIKGKTVIVSYNLLNYDDIFFQIVNKPWDIFISDEFHYLSNIESKRTSRVLFNGGVVQKANHNWFLSGTPVTGKPAGLFPILMAIARRRLHPYTDWLRYIKHFCNAYQDEYGAWAHHGSSNLEDLADRLGSVMLRRLVKDVEPDLEKPLYFEVKLQLPPEDTIKYEDQIEQLDGSIKYESAGRRSILANIKGRTIYEHLKLIMENERKIIVFYHHKAVGRYLKARTQRVSYLIDGSVLMKKRHGIVKAFAKNKHAILFAQSDAAGTGLDGLQQDCYVAYFAEMPWLPDTRDQNVRRLCRIGQKRKVKVVVPIIQDTVDEEVYAGWHRKEKVNKIILKGK